MPVYEFRCNSCRQKSSLLVRNISTSLSPACPACGGHDLTKLISSFAYHRSEKSRLAETSESSPDYYKDPRNIGRWTERKFKEMGMEMPSQIEDMIQAARDGEMPESLKDLKSGPTQI